jgi:hypothetical protein
MSIPIWPHISIGFNGGDVNLYRMVKNNPIRYIDPYGLDAWSGAGDSVSGFLFFGGVGTTYGWVKNWETGEKCYIEIRSYRVGVGLGGGITASSIWIPNGPHRGEDLSGVSISMGIEGGLGGYVSGSPGGTVGVNSSGNVGISAGAGIGAGAAEYAEYSLTRVISCECD